MTATPVADVRGGARILPPASAAGGDEDGSKCGLDGSVDSTEVASGSALRPPGHHPLVLGPPFYGCHQGAAQRAVECLADDVGMSGMPCSLLDEVEQYPSDGASLGIGVPRRRRQRHTPRQVVDAADGSGSLTDALPSGKPSIRSVHPRSAYARWVTIPPMLSALGVGLSRAWSSRSPCAALRTAWRWCSRNESRPSRSSSTRGALIGTHGVSHTTGPVSFERAGSHRCDASLQPLLRPTHRCARGELSRPAAPPRRGPGSRRRRRQRIELGNRPTDHRPADHSTT